MGRSIASYLRRLAHVVDGKNDHGIDAVFADPLRRDQFREIAPNVERIIRVEIREPVAVRGEWRGEASVKYEKQHRQQTAQFHRILEEYAGARAPRGFLGCDLNSRAARWSPSPLNGEGFPEKISRIEPLNAQRSADFQIGAIMPGFSNAPIWKSALQFMERGKGSKTLEHCGNGRVTEAGTWLNRPLNAGGVVAARQLPTFQERFGRDFLSDSTGHGDKYLQTEYGRLGVA